MCGIAGFYSPEVQDPGLVQRMGEMISHRGPDEQGTYVQQGVHLQHQRLSIVDLKQGQQPMVHPDNGLAVTYNGEIYNHREIRSMHLQDSVFKTQCDTEVLLHAYERWGARMLSHLNGMFAFFIYSPQERKLFLARDRLGQKPLYYSLKGKNFAFASEITSILELPWVNRELDQQAVSQYFAHEHVPCPRTPFKDIRKCPPGHFMVYDIERDELNIECWWKPSFRVDPQFESLDRAVETFEHHWQRSLNYRMMADVPLGVFLSGGIDSSACLSSLTRSFPDRRFKSFSVGFDNKSFDERSHARTMANHCQSDHHEAILQPSEMLSVLPTIEKHMLDPIADASIIPTTLLCQYTRQNVTVAIGGDAADELLCGYPTFLAHRLLGNIPWPNSMVNLFRYLAGKMPTNMDNISLDFKIKQTLSGLAYSNPIRNEIWLGGSNPTSTPLLLSGLAPELTNPESVYAEEIRLWNESDSDTTLGKIQEITLNSYMGEGILTKVDRASMFHSLEVRSPFLDVNLVEFLNALPMKHKQSLLKGKILLRKAMAPHLPSSILERPKKGFGMPISHWFRKELKDDLHYRIQEAPPFFNKRFLMDCFIEHQRGEADHRKILFPYFMFFPVLKAGGTL